MLIRERGKVIRKDGIRLPNRQGMKDIDEDDYTYLGILEIDKINEIKEKCSKEYLQWLRLILTSKLNGKK